MRIALVCDGFSALGGVQEFVAHLAAELARAKHPVAILSTPSAAPAAGRALPPDIEAVVLRIEPHRPVTLRHPERLFRTSPSVAEPLAFIRRWRPDVVSSHLWHWDEIPTLVRACEAARVPMVHSLYDSWGRGADGIRALQSLSRAGALTALSDATRRYFEPLVPAARDAQVCLAGVDLGAAEAASPQARARPYLLCAARLDLRHKAIDDLLDAFAIVARERPEVDLLITGDGPDRECLVRQADALSISARVEFLGAVARDALWSLYKGALFFAMPSRLPEGLGLVFLESMACGRPVIGTKSGGVPEIVRDGVDGILVPANDRAALAAAMRTMLGDADARERMGANGAAIVRERFGWDQVANRFLSVYSKCLAAGAPNQPRMRA